VVKFKRKFRHLKVNKSNQTHKFSKFYFVKKKPTCFGYFLCLSSGVFYCTFGFQAGSGWNRVPSWPCFEAVIKPARNIPMPNIRVENSRWWAKEMPEIRRVFWQNKIGKFVHVVGFIKKKTINDLMPRIKNYLTLPVLPFTSPLVQQMDKAYYTCILFQT
jgi:hypothetical protein